MNMDYGLQIQALYLRVPTKHQDTIHFIWYAWVVEYIFVNAENGDDAKKSTTASYILSSLFIQNVDGFSKRSRKIVNVWNPEKSFEWCILVWFLNKRF